MSISVSVVRNGGRVNRVAEPQRIFGSNRYDGTSSRWFAADAASRFNRGYEVGQGCPKFCGGVLHRARVFCLSLGDWLDEEVPIEWLRDLLILIHATPNLDWQLLTKRPQNWRSRIQAVLDIEEPDAESRNGIVEANGEPGWALKLFAWLGNSKMKVEPFPNVWIGVSAGAYIEAALDIPAKIHFLSCEPMLKPLDTSNEAYRHFDWIIFGGESGIHARPCELQWIDDGIDFCSRHGIACFVKQLGRHPQPRRFPTTGVQYTRETLRLTDLHGGDWNEWPKGDERFRDLRHREFPK